MENFEFKSAVCTSIEQSKRLLELGLKKETADMYITNMSRKGINYTDDWQIGAISYCDAMSFWDSKGLQLEKTAWSIIPAWSLDRLRELIPENIFTGVRNQWHRVMYNGVLTYEEGDDSLVSFREANIYDRCISCIEWLINEGYFNKDYLEEKK